MSRCAWLVQPLCSRSRDLDVERPPYGDFGAMVLLNWSDQCSGSKSLLAVDIISSLNVCLVFRPGHL